MHRKKILAGFAVAAAAAIATLSLSGSANATSPVSTSVSPSGLVYGCIVPETHTGTPIVDWHGVYKAGDKCGTSHQLVVWTAGTKVPTGPKGDPGKNGTNGTNGKDGKDGTNAQALPYGIALVNVSRGGAAATTWATYSTTIGSPVGDTASGTFRMSCSAAKAPCVITVQAYSTTAGVTVYPRVDINREDTNDVPAGNCEYGDGTDNNGSSSPELSHDSTSPSNIKLGIGGTLDCGSAQTYPTDGIATEIDVPAGFYDIASTFTFKK
jgi:hypothetical protein